MVVTAVLAFGTTRSAAAQDPAPMQWPDAPPASTPAPAPAQDDERPPGLDRTRVRGALHPDADLADARRRARGLVGGGAGMLAGAGTSIVIAGGCLVASWTSGPTYEDDPDFEGDEGSRRAAVGFAITSVVLLAVGAPLLAAGIRQRREVAAASRRRLAVATGPRGFGLRF